MPWAAIGSTRRSGRRRRCSSSPARPMAPGSVLSTTRMRRGSAPCVVRDSCPRTPDSAIKLKKRTLTNLYSERPAWLANAHRKLDEAVFAAYGWPADLSDDELLAKLLALNLERAAP